jgi:NADPH:quinone reductase-like Zn-dependent oxidoreductase
MLQSAGNMFVQGCELDFKAVNQSSTDPQGSCPINDFEPYPFSEHHYWHESRVSKQHRLKPFPRHNLLGLQDDVSSDLEPSWRNTLTSDDIPWLKDHRMQSLAVFPLAGYICMAVEAASQRAQLRGIQQAQIGGFRFREVRVSKALILDDGSAYETHFAMQAYAEGTRSYSHDWDEFRISSWTLSRGWLEHCRGLVAITKPNATNVVHRAPLQTSKARRSTMQAMRDCTLDLDKFYNELGGLGAAYSSVFSLGAASNLRCENNYSAADLYVPDTKTLMPFAHESQSIVPTAFLDLFFQLTFAILGAGNGQISSLYMPSAIKEVVIGSAMPNQPGESLQVVAYTPQDTTVSGPVDFVIEGWTQDGTEPVVKLDGFRMTPVYSDDGDGPTPRSLCYGIEWQPVPPFLQPSSKVVVGNGNSHPEPSNVTNGHANGCVNGHANGDHANSNGSLNGHVNGNTHVAKSHKIPLPGYLDGSRIALITGANPDKLLLSSLVDLIDLKTGTEPLVSTFSDLDICSSTRYICLVELESSLLLDMQQPVFEKLKAMLTTSASVLWVTRGAYRFAKNPENNISQGLLRTVRSELSKAAASIDLDPQSNAKPEDAAQLILDALKHSLIAPDGGPVDYEFAEQDGKLVVPRVLGKEDINLALSRETQGSRPYLQPWEQPDRRLKVEVGTLGALDSLYWRDEELKPLGDDEIEIKVVATGMNFKDVVIAMGQVHSPYLGVECSGIVARVGANVRSLRVGDRACAMSLGAYSTFARCLATSAALIPSGMGFETAASVPVVYSTAYYGIVELARIQAAEKILIHAGSGGVGQAAIQIAQRMGADIYTTVSTNEKKKLIMDSYGLPEDHIFYSRDGSFAPALMEATGGLGVDVVINSLAGDLLRETWECLAPFGRFIEIGKKDITSNTRLEMSKFEYNCSFHSVDLTLLAEKRPKVMERVLGAVMQLLSAQVISPIGPLTTVGISDVESCLRKLQNGKIAGKVVVRHNATDQVKVSRRRTLLFLPTNRN